MMRRFAILIFVSAVSFCVPIFSQNSGEGSVSSVLTIKQIDALIADTDYNAALTALTQYIRVYPDHFDEAQKRIAKILLARERYAKKAEELIAVIQNDPGNDELVLNIIAELSTLEKNPRAEQLAFIENARVAAQFNSYRKTFLELQERADSLRDAGNYAAAVDVNRSGFYMYYDDFFDEYAGQEIANDVKAVLDSIDVNIERYKNIQDRFNRVCAAFVATAQSLDVAETKRAFVNVQNVSAEFSEIRNDFFRNAADIYNIFTELHTDNPNVTDASFLPFVRRYVSGRDGIYGSGILGIADIQWDTEVGNMKNAVAGAIQSLNGRFSNVTWNNFVWAASEYENFLDDSIEFAVIGSNVNALYGLLETDDGTKAGSFPEYDASLVYMSRLASLIKNIANSTRKFVQIDNEISNITMPTNPGEAERAGSNYVARLTAVVSSLDTVAASIPYGDYENEDWAVTYRNYERRWATETEYENTAENADKKGRENILGTPVISWSSLETVYKDCKQEIDDFIFDTASSCWKKAGAYYKDCSELYVNSADGMYAHAQQLYEGAPFEDGSMLIAHYPREALTEMEQLAGQISTDRNILISARAVLDGSTYRRTVDPDIAIVDNAIARLSALNTNVARLSAGAREAVQNSRNAENEAELRYNQARTAMNNGDFETARRRLQESRTRFNDSLSYQESAALRSSSDERLASLGEEINRRENEVIVAEVRRLKTEARTEYYNGNFENAEALLNRAAARWAVTNIEPDSEIASLLALVTTALSMHTGRVISASAPLYPEMSQTLSIARTFFDEGESLIKAGNRTAGREALERSLQKLQELQLVYPLNQDASLLTLRIQQTLDPQGFNGLFAERVAHARASYTIPTESQVAYTNLLDLYEINPNYPGLRQLIYDVEIAIGVRQKPVDTTNLTRSNNLTTQAQSIVNRAGRDEVTLRSALALVDEAIQLNPNNDSAMLLKDRIQIAIGGGAVVVFSAEDESRYQQAIQAMQSNNIITANAIVEQLLQNPANRRSSKLLDLQKQIRALL